MRSENVHPACSAVLKAGRGTALVLQTRAAGGKALPGHSRAQAPLCREGSAAPVQPRVHGQVRPAQPSH